MAPIAVTLALCFGLAQSMQVSRVSGPPGNTIEGYFWASQGGNGGLSASADYGPSAESLKAGPRWVWQGKDDELVRTSPLFDKQKNIYVSTINGKVKKFSPAGTELWTYQGAAMIPDVPALSNGSLFFTDARGMVTKLDMETGKAVWSKSACVEDAIASAGDAWSMTAAMEYQGTPGIVIAAVSTNEKNNNILVALDPDTGDVKWHFRPDEMLYKSMAANHLGRIVFSDQTGKVYQLDMQTGELVWKAGPGAPGESIEPGFSPGGTVLGMDGTVFTTSNALRVDSGSVRPSGYVTAFRWEDGSVLWRTPTEYAANTAPAAGLINGKLAVAVVLGENPDIQIATNESTFQVLDGDQSLKKRKARILALDAATGKQIWRHELRPWQAWADGDARQSFHVCLADISYTPPNPIMFTNMEAGQYSGTVYVGFQSGAFYGVTDWNQDGTIDESEAVQYDSHSSFQGSPALADGMLAATHCNSLSVFGDKVPGPGDVPHP